MRKNILLPLCILFTTVSFYSAQADELRDRKGFVIGFGVGGGGISLNGVKKGAVLTNFIIGGGISERILLLAESSSGATHFNSQTIAVSGLYLTSQLFLVDQFYIRPGVGISGTETDQGSLTTSSDRGFSALASVGYEFRLTPRFALSPEGKLCYARINGGDFYYYGAQADLRWYF